MAYIHLPACHTFYARCLRACFWLSSLPVLVRTIIGTLLVTLLPLLLVPVPLLLRAADSSASCSATSWALNRSALASYCVRLPLLLASTLTSTGSRSSWMRASCVGVAGGSGSFRVLWCLINSLKSSRQQQHNCNLNKP